MTFNDIDKLRNRVGLLDGKLYVALSSKEVTELRQTATSGQWLDIQKAVHDPKCFGAICVIGNYNGLLLLEHP